MSDGVSELRRAAVVIPVLERDGELAVLLTRRPERLSAHPGEICFPGGKVDAGDGSALAAACRELEEEVGIATRHVLGYARTEGAVTASSFYIEPFVMRIASGAEVRPSPGEVSEWCLLRLADALQLDRYRIEEFSVARDDFGFVFPTPLGPVRNATCTMLLQFVKQLCRHGSFEAYARTFKPLAR
jgi:8-oxo-dGTP pyrophosphatase MutT (NUDIX family)